LPVSVDTQRAIDLDDRAEVELPQDLALLVDDTETATEVDDATAAKPAIVMPQRKTANDQTHAAADALTTAADVLTVARVEPRQGSTGPYYVAILSDGRSLSTKDHAVAKHAENVAAKRTAIRVLTKAVADRDPGVDGTAVLVITPPPDAEPNRAPRLDEVRS